jgi:hypothetical protein
MNRKIRSVLFLPFGIAFFVLFLIGFRGVPPIGHYSIIGPSTR